jgi:prepilin-type N-terminal cleavage/methylation domain-containing protein/prepilin-type processing-associated H-X9-DG protein
MMKRKGFTLIELLVVIAIIAILAAILFPVFAKAREKARQSTCASNLKQLSLAFMNYIQDYDEMIPYAYLPGAGYPWYRIIPSYINNSDSAHWHNLGVTHCPSDKEYKDQVNGSPSGHACSYGMNTNLSNKALAKIAAPSDTLLLVDTVHNTTGVIYSVYGPWGASGNNYYAGIALTRHSDGANIAFLDGHVKWMKNIPASGYPW